MMRTENPAAIPQLKTHSPSGQAYVIVEKRRVYLGRHDRPETQQRYKQFLAQWLGNGERLDVPADDLTITELVDRYVEHAEAYYRRPDGTPATEQGNVRTSVLALNNLFGDMLVSDFKCRHLRTLRDGWIRRGLRRKTVNDYTSHCKRMFKWAVSNDLIAVQIYQALMTIEGLRAGRSAAAESVPVRPVLESHVNAIEPFVPRIVWLAVQLQLHCGGRSSEVLGLRPMDISTAGPVWTAEIRQHKASHHGRPRVLCFGPRSQQILRELMQDCGIANYLFDPHRALTEYAAAAPGHRRDDQPETPRKTDRVIGDRYTQASYRKCVQRACVEAKIPVWHPHQLRHLAGTLARREAGLDGAQVFLGHSDARVTELYSELDLTKAASVALAIG